MNRPEYNSSYFPHWTGIKVRFRDLDPLNHVNNAIFSTYYEEARIHFIQKIPGVAAQLESGFSFVLATIRIDFIKPVSFPAELLIGSGIKSKGNTSITSFQAIYKEETKELVSVAEASGGWFDVKKQRPSPLPEVEGIKRFMVEL